VAAASLVLRRSGVTVIAASLEHCAQIGGRCPEAVNLRDVISEMLAREPPKKGGILAALRRSPLVRADLEAARSREAARKIDL